jgi:hypothetical protein
MSLQNRNWALSAAVITAILSPSTHAAAVTAKVAAAPSMEVIQESQLTSGYTQSSLDKSWTASSIDIAPLLSASGASSTLRFSPAPFDNTDGKTCLLNKAEVPVGIKDGTPLLRFVAEFGVDLSKTKIDNIKATIVESTSARAPFRVKVTYDLTDMTLKTVRKADISFACMGHDRNIEVQIRGISGTVYLLGPKAPNKKEDLKFSIEPGTASVSLSKSIKATTDAQFKIPGLTILQDLIESELNKDSSKAAIQSAISNAIGAGLGSLMTTFLNATFLSKSEFKSGVSTSDLRGAKEATYRSRSTTHCSTGPCAEYLWKK